MHFPFLIMGIEIGTIHQKCHLLRRAPSELGIDLDISRMRQGVGLPTAHLARGLFGPFSGFGFGIERLAARLPLSIYLSIIYTYIYIYIHTYMFFMIR